MLGVITDVDESPGMALDIAALEWICRPPTAPPTAAPITINDIIAATNRKVRTFMPKMIRGGPVSLSSSDACLPE